MELYELRQRQSLPLDAKVEHFWDVLRKYDEHFDGDIGFSFSGGKCSDVGLWLARKRYPKIPAVFAPGGVQYPGIIKHVRETENVHWCYPKVTIRQVFENYGMPVISKKNARFISDLQNPTPGNEATRHLRDTGYTLDGEYMPSMKLPEVWKPLVDSGFKISDKCCECMKEGPLDRFYEKNGLHRVVATQASESRRRQKEYLQYGCTNFTPGNARCAPLSIFTDDDVLVLIRDESIPYAKDVYGEIVETLDGHLTTTLEKRTGCMFCMFGVHLEERPNRFQRMDKYYHRLWEYCINDLGCGKVLDFIGVPYRWRDLPTQLPLFPKPPLIS